LATRKKQFAWTTVGVIYACGVAMMFLAMAAPAAPSLAQVAAGGAQETI
jgi:hypothetical protein